MEPARGDSPKLPDMVMCGDHPSFTKTELNAKEIKPEDKVPAKDKIKDRSLMSYARLSPSASHTEQAAERTRALSEHALRLLEARRRGREVDTAPREDMPPHRALVQAALGSFRWPPYLVAVWVLVLLLTHSLHCLVAVLEKSLPAVRKSCQYFRTWTEESWKSETEANRRVLPLALAAATGLLYALYAALYAARAAAAWAVEPLVTDDGRDVETKVTNYIDEVNSNSSTKQ